MLPNRRDWLSHLVSWQLITGEYPPQPGGVSDYSQQVAAGLAEAGDDVQVWAPSAEKMDSKDRGVSVHGLIDRFGPRSLARMSRDLNSEGLTPGSIPPTRLRREGRKPCVLYLAFLAAQQDADRCDVSRSRNAI